MNKKLIIIIVSLVASISVTVGVVLGVTLKSDSDKADEDKKDNKKQTEAVDVGGENNAKPTDSAQLNGNNTQETVVDSTVASGNENTTVPVTVPAINQGGNQGGNSDIKPDNPPKQENKAPDTTAEIVAYYKNAVNYAKKNSKSVVRVKDGAVNYNGIVEAGNLTSVADSLMDMFMSPSEYDIPVINESRKGSDIPPAGVNCNLTASGVKSATIVDNGTTYKVTIVAKDCTNPKAGSDGVGSLINVVVPETIQSSVGSVPGLTLENINIAYENVTVIATIDKATGGLLEMKINAPSVLSLYATMPILGKTDGKVGIQCISEYTVNY